MKKLLVFAALIIAFASCTKPKLEYFTTITEKTVSVSSISKVEANYTSEGYFSGYSIYLVNKDSVVVPYPYQVYSEAAIKEDYQKAVKAR